MAIGFKFSIADNQFKLKICNKTYFGGWRRYCYQVKPEDIIEMNVINLWLILGVRESSNKLSLVWVSLLKHILILYEKNVEKGD
jgi:hypothetical protein